MDGMEWGYTWNEFYSDATYQQLNGQSAIVTGANSGIGFELAKALVQNGVDVTLTCRTTAKCEAAKKDIQDAPSDDNKSKGKVTYLLLDTSSFQSVRNFCQDYVSQIGKSKPIDMLFLNAGFNFGAPKDGSGAQCMPKTEADGISSLFQINYLSHHLMYQLLEPFFAKDARVVSTSSCSSYDTYTYKVATDLETLHGCSEPYVDPKTGSLLSYGESKLAQIMWSTAVQRNLLKAGSDISVNAFHPGLVDTGVAQKINAVTDVPVMMEALMMNYMLPNAWKSPEGALTGLFLGTHGNVKGKYYHPQSIEVTNPLALDEEHQDKLLNFSNELVRDYMEPLSVQQPATE